MSKSTTPNVFITTSREVIEDFLKISVNKTKTKKFLNTLGEEDKKRSIIAGPEINSNLIELEHTNGMGGDGHYIRLRLVENGQSFESQFIRTDVYPELINNVAKQKKQLNGNFLELETDLKNKILDPAKYAYFCYGIGEFLTDWAGPFVMQFIKGEIIINDNGVKEIVLEFRGEVGKLLRNEIESVSVDKTYSLLNKYENFYSNKLVMYNTTVELDKNESSKFAALRTEVINEKIKVLFKRYIMGLINDYSDPKIGQSARTYSLDENLNVNIITLIPRIDLITKSLVQDTIDKNIFYTAKQKREEFANRQDANTERLRQLSDARAAREASDARSRGQEDLAKNWEINIRQEVFKPDLSNWDNTVYRRPNADQLIKKITPDTIIKKLGLDSEVLYDKVQTQASATNGSPSRNKDVNDEAIPEAASRLSKLKISLALDPSQKDTMAEITPDFYQPIQKFNDNFKLLCFDQYKIDYDPVLIVENDMRVLKLWEEFGFIKDHTKPTFIYGHQPFISDLLYLENSFTIKEAEKISIAVDKLMKSDKDSYDSVKYRLNYYEAFRKKRKNSSFGENVSRNDELAVDAVVIDLANALDIPIFRHNIANPNVISVSLQNNLVYKQVMDFGFKNQAISKTIDYGLVKIPEDIDENTILVAERDYQTTSVKGSTFWQAMNAPLGSKESMVKYLVDQNTSIVDQKGSQIKVKEIKDKILQYIETDKTNPDAYNDPYYSDPDGYAIIFKDFQSKTIEEKFQATNFFLTKYIKGYEDSGQFINKDVNIEALAYSLVLKSEGQSPQVFVQTKNEEQKTSFQTQLYRQLNSLVFQINIKTLPFFGVQGPLTNIQCFFIGLQNMIGSMKKTPSIYNGVYYILGYRHLISSRETFSEFQLSRTPTIQGRD